MEKSCSLSINKEFRDETTQRVEVNIIVKVWLEIRRIFTPVYCTPF